MKNKEIKKELNKMFKEVVNSEKRDFGILKTVETKEGKMIYKKGYTIRVIGGKTLNDPVKYIYSTGSGMSGCLN